MGNNTVQDDERVRQVKESVQRMKLFVTKCQARLSEENGQSTTRSRRDQLKKELQNGLTALNVAKKELRNLSGVGADPKWQLIKAAYVVLTRLEEAGVNIGEAGENLLSDIEFHMPMAKLMEALEADAAKAETK